MALSSKGPQSGGAGAASGAMNGLQLGSNFGPWGALIGAAAGAVGGTIEDFHTSKSQAKVLKMQNKVVAEQERLRQEQNNALYKEMGRAYVENMKQRNYEYANTSKAIDYIQRTSGQMKADITVQNAMSDAIGASAQAVYSAVDASTDHAIQAQYMALETELDNADTALTSMLNQAKSMVNTATYNRVVGNNNASYNTAAFLGLAEAGVSAYSSGMFEDFFKKDEKQIVGMRPETAAEANIRHA